MSSRSVAALALVPTPLLLFVSPALRLYLGNQADLYYQSSVLAPFLGLGLFALAVGALAWSWSKLTPFRYLTWAFLLLAPFLLAYRFLAGATPELPGLLGLAVGWSVESGAGLALWCLGWIAVSGWAGHRFPPRAIASWMAVFGVVLLAGDVLAFANGVRRNESAGQSSIDEVRAPRSLPEAPNVYHIVLDELQTEVFELIRSAEIEGALGGFVNFPNNRAIYHSTVMSLGSTFSSRRYRYDEPRGRYIEASFGPRSVVAHFAADGYWTLALVPESDPVDSGDAGFDAVLFHTDNFERSASMTATAFRNLWIVANVPPVLLDGLAARGLVSARTQAELRLTRAGRALTDSAPVASAMSFRALVENEPRLAESGRYTFVHLLIPHSPYVLGDDCSFRAGESFADPSAQTRCTFALVADLLDELEALERFDDALIVVHGDHGAPFRGRGATLVPARARSLRTPLLIKPPGRARGEPLVSCNAGASLLDVAPTLLDALRLPPASEHEGTSLLPALEGCL